MKMYKKYLMLPVMTALAIFLFYGCSSPVLPNSSKAIELTVWNYYSGPQQAAFDDLTKEFNNTIGQDMGITVKTTNLGSVNKLTEAVMDSAQKKVGSPDMPDIFAAYTDTALAIDQMGLVADLDSYFSEQELERFLPEYIEEGRFSADGALKIFPVAKSTEVMLINKTDWDRFSTATWASLDDLATIEGLAETARNYYNWTDEQTPEPNDGKAFFGRDSLSNYMYIGYRQLGKEIFEIDGGNVTFNLDKDILRRLWEGYYVPYIRGYYGNFNRYATDNIKTGQTIAMVGSTTGASFFPEQVMFDNNSGYDIEMLALPAPRFLGADDFAVQQGAGLVVTKSDPVTEEAAVTFLKWITQDENNLRLSLRSGYIPVTKSTSNIKTLEDFVSRAKAEPLSTGLVDALNVALETVNSCEMYTCKAFAGGTESRNILESSLLDRAKADRATVLSMIAGGLDYEDAVAYVNSDYNFENWVLSLERALSPYMS